ncbi:MAG: threonylcarbamoyl-AMP synthase [Methylococcales bacterium]|jgi:tRNA threonylcarbamoyl adenosine modification protein (Sua5/YciO/YrdC/YwlC family)|nr:threonylcarbamoyl-AMP synthase [Methylococcales bacterium]MBT7410306.1 threonylcarbamoyl-AMP synthase [Methylococcales bacterium]
MTYIYQIHPDNPQPRLINQVVDVIRQGGVIVYPTDSCYALGCHMGDKNAIEVIRNIRQIDKKQNLSLICKDLSEISAVAKVDNTTYRFIKNITPGPYTFILKATREIPKRLLHPKKKTIGIRVPDNKITHALLDALGESLITSTLIMPDDEYPLTDPYEMKELLDHSVDVIIDGGYCGIETTTVIDFIEGSPTIVRKGLGNVDFLE